MDDASDSAIRLEPLAYHRAIVSYLKEEDPRVWSWFESNRLEAAYAENVRLSLLKTSYRLDPEEAPGLYEAGAEVQRRLGIEAPLTFYQSQDGSSMNAALAFIPAELHVVLQGPITSALSELELRCLLAHEFAHYLLFEGWDGEVLIAQQVLDALADDVDAQAAHVETARVVRLYTEIFADRAALAVSESLEATVSTLIKVQTGLSEVNGASYLRQSEEIFAKSKPVTDGITHPESYIRARAAKLWSERGDDAAEAVQRMMLGAPSLEGLDLLGQRDVEKRTRRLIDEILLPGWMQSELMLAHARLFFPDFQQGQEAKSLPLAELLADGEADLRDYWCYVLLDFAAADPELDDVPLARALLLARECGLEERLEELAAKELGIGKRKLASLRKKAEELVAAAGDAP